MPDGLPKSAAPNAQQRERICGRDGLNHPKKNSEDLFNGLVYYRVYSRATEDQPKQ
jgi:hypothetical protein